MLAQGLHTNNLFTSLPFDCATHDVDPACHKQLTCNIYMSPTMESFPGHMHAL